MRGKFIGNNYAVMRHARDGRKPGVPYDADEETQNAAVFITDEGMQQLRESLGRFFDHLDREHPGKKLVIHHSPLRRAELTALAAEECAKTCGREVTLVKTPWLTSDEHGLTNENITPLIKQDDGTFFLFVTHLPEVQHYLRLGSEGYWPNAGICWSEE